MTTAYDGGRLSALRTGHNKLIIKQEFVHEVGQSLRLYWDARSAKHQSRVCYVLRRWNAAKDGCDGGRPLVLSNNRLTPNDPYMGRTAPLTSKRCISCIYSTNIGTEYFKHALYSPFFALQNAVCFIMLTCLVPVLFTFYIQDVLQLKK